MAKSNVLEKIFIDAIFAGAAVPAAATLYISLHTAEPDQNGDQTQFEASYIGYARQPVAVPAGFDVSGEDRAVNADDIIFPANTGVDQTVTHFGVGLAASGIGDLYYIGVLTAETDIEVGVSLKITAGSLVIIED